MDRNQHLSGRKARPAPQAFSSLATILSVTNEANCPLNTTMSVDRGMTPGDRSEQGVGVCLTTSISSPQDLGPSKTAPRTLPSHPQKASSLLQRGKATTGTLRLWVRSPDPVAGGLPGDHVCAVEVSLAFGQSAAA